MNNNFVGQMPMQPAPQPNGMVTRQEFDNLSAKMDQMMQILQDFKQ